MSKETDQTRKDMFIISHGTNKQKDAYINHKDPFFRQLLATHGTKEHLDALKNDLDPLVRGEVSRVARKRRYYDLVDHFSNDPDDYVRAHAQAAKSELQQRIKNGHQD